MSETRRRAPASYQTGRCSPPQRCRSSPPAQSPRPTTSRCSLPQHSAHRQTSAKNPATPRRERNHLCESYPCHPRSFHPQRRRCCQGRGPSPPLHSPCLRNRRGGWGRCKHSTCSAATESEAARVADRSMRASSVCESARERTRRPKKKTWGGV